MRNLFYTGLFAGLFSCAMFSACSQEEKNAPLPDLPKVELPKGLAGLYVGRLPCDNCKARMVRMEIAEDSSVSVVETVIVDTAKADSLKGRFSQVEGKVVVALDNGAKWNFQVGNSGALSLLTGTGDLIRIINKPKVEGEKP